jgi:hypothetical protein
MLELVTADSVAALVSTVPDTELRMGRDAITTHARVLEDVHARETVLPMRFGLVMGGDQIRRELLDARREELVSQLAEFADKVELKLRATYDEQTLLRDLVIEDREIANLRASLQGAPEDATYYARIRLGELVAHAIERKRALDAEQILEELSPLAVAVEAVEPTHERIALNASFLVPREGVARFDAAVDRIGEAQAGRLRLRSVGPLPPHSFVRFALEV